MHHVEIPPHGEITVMTVVELGTRTGAFECPMRVYLDDGGLLQTTLVVRGTVRPQ